jgi:hypothetical protein
MNVSAATFLANLPPASCQKEEREVTTPKEKEVTTSKKI